MTAIADEVEAGIAGRIAQLLQRRQERLPRIVGEIARWRGIDKDLGDLAIALEALRRHPTVSDDAAVDLAIPHLHEIKANIADVIDQYHDVEARYSRDTVNVGVSGSARVGKSTLLQSISGLTDEQIPTGRDLPVTAVRSRIYHSPRTRAAVLSLHSPETFLAEVIRPYHQALNLTGDPASIEDFRNWIYQAPSESGEVANSGDVALLVRLREMQQGLWSYEEDLRGSEKSVRLEELRPYVAYPTSQERGGSARLEHRYLAVRDVRIDCPFPCADVERLGIIDLPGLGEIAADAEEHHLTGLRQDVDVVLLVKRAAEGMAYWSASDAQAINLLDKARGFIRNRGDFVFIVVNSRPQDSELAEPLRADILRQVNDGQASRHFVTLNADVAEPESVRDAVLLPLLHMLADRLPVMDEECLTGAQERAASVTSRIRMAVLEVQESLSSLRTPTGAMEDLEDRANELRDDLAEHLGGLVAELYKQATQEEDDPGYVEAIETAYEDVDKWVKGGFGKGEEDWCRLALRSFRRHRSAGPYSVDELNRIRVEISNKFARLDDFFSRQIEVARERVGMILRDNLGDLLTGVPDGDQHGTRLLQRTVELLTDASEPCKVMSDAVELLLTLRLDYRTQLHPRVRRQLDGLNPQRLDPIHAVVKDFSPDGALDLFKYVTDQASQAAWDTKKALLEEQVTPLLVIHAAVEQFEDTLIRAGLADREFRRFGRSYRDELWPGQYSGLTEAHARYASVAKLLKAISEKLS